MSTAIGQRMIGSGVKLHSACGNGLGRTIASSLIGSLGSALVNKIASAVKGGSFKVTGGRKKRVARPRKVGRPKKR